MKKMLKKSVIAALSVVVMSWNSLGFCAPATDAATTETSFRPATESPLNFALDIQFLPARYPRYEYAEDVRSNNFGSGVRVAFEWLPLANKYGKGGIGGGFGYAKVGKVPMPDGSSSSIETFPLDAFLTYRLDYWNNQPIVPFVKWGMERQYARQKASNSMRRYNGWEYGGGVSILLDAIDSKSAHDFDNSIGINNTYLTIEYIKSQMAGSDREINLSRDELRAGLRFEM